MDDVRRFSLGLWVALLIVAAAAAMVPEAADAGVYNVRPANAFEEPAEEFVDDDALFAYSTVDTRGGGICIVEDTVTHQNYTSHSCDRPAWGTTNSVVGIGTTYSLLEGPPLQVGTWKLLSVDSEGTPNSLSESFTVTACDTCSREIADAIVQQWKDSARAMALVSRATCTGWGLAGALRDADGAIRAAHGKVTKLTQRLDDFASGRTGFVATIVPVAAGAALGGLAFPTVDSAIFAGADKAKEILKQLVCAVGAMYGDIVADPPDPDYDSVAAPSFRPIGDLGHPASNTLATSLDAQYAHAESSLHGFERYLGATADDDQPGVHRQARAAATQTRALIDSLYDTADNLRSYAAAVDDVPELAGPIIEDEDAMDTLVRTYERVQADGFTADELAELQSRGYSAQEIADIRTHFELDPSVLPVGADLSSLMRTAADDVESAIAGFDLFAREAAAVAARTNGVPQAAFTSRADDADPLKITFTDTTEDPDEDPLVVTWDFGDGATGSGPEVTHVYASPGSYLITQTASDGAASTTVTRTIAVGETPNVAPTASFTATPATGDAALDVSFDAAASTDPEGPIAQYAWSFGDGAFGTGVATAHTYTIVGTYTVTLTVTDAGGETDMTTRTVTVTRASGGGPIAAFTATPERGFAPLAVAFDATGSSDPGGSIASYAWDFGDGSTAAGATANHTYDSPGTYTATLTVTDDAGLIATATRSIVARGPNNPPVAAFSATPERGLVPLSVVFNAAASGDADGPIASYAWDFDDGMTGSGLSPTHVFGAVGTYTVMLTVTDEDGVSATAAKDIEVRSSNAAPTARFTTTPETAEVSQNVYFDASQSTDSDGSIVSYDWNLGNGGVTQGPTINYAYASAGTYTVTLTVTDDTGATDVATRTLTIAPFNEPPTAAFSATPQVTRVGQDVAFDASASDDDGTITAYAWTFGSGGGVATGQQVTHRFATTGVFRVSLRVTDDQGKSATVVHSVAVEGAPVARPDGIAASPAGVVDVLANDTDYGNDALHVIATTDPAHGTADCGDLGGCIYTADAGYTGPDTFDYTVRDADGDEAGATVSVDVGEPPGRVARLVAIDDDRSTTASTPVTLDALANDRGDDLRLTDSEAPQHGVAACDEAGTCTYTPNPGFSGADGFGYTVTDGSNATATASVRVIVSPPDTGFGAVVGRAASGSASVVEGEDADWQAAAPSRPAGVSGEELAALPAPELFATLSGRHTILADEVTAPRGWTATRGGDGRDLRITAGSGALLGEAVSQAIPRPLPPINQGTGGDGHVPILVGTKVFAFFHHSFPTSVTCVDRTTGTLCAGYPIRLSLASTDINGPAAVVGTKIWVHLLPAGGYAQSAPVSLLCWDTETAQPCGFVVAGRLQAPDIDTTFLPNPGASAPVLAAGKIWMLGDQGVMHCVDPATSDVCDTPSIDTGLPEVRDYQRNYDIVTHAGRVYAARSAAGEVVCVDAVAGTRCDGWATPRVLMAEAWNLVTRHSATGRADGICAVATGTMTCVSDEEPQTAQTTPGWPGRDHYYGATLEAETGTRTLIATHGTPGLTCWDWVTMGVCEGGRWGASGLGTDNEGRTLPSAYGAAFDGSCVVGLGDPGQVFTVDPAGSAPCTSLQSGTEQQTIDLRDQRCDGTVGEASWQRVALVDASGGGLASVVVTVRDASTNEVLATRELVGTNGTLDLSAIDAVAHPALTLNAVAQADGGDTAWQDGIPPRIRLSWISDPQQVCFTTRTVADCAAPLDPIGVAVRLGPTGAVATKELALTRAAGCNGAPALAAVANRAIDEGEGVDVTLQGSDPDSDGLRYQLLAGPAGMTVDAITGRLTWSTGELDGPGTAHVRVEVRDLRTPSLSAEREFDITVREVNRAPELAAIADQTAAVGAAVTFDARATDPDVPAQTLRFTLVDAPAGASIDAVTGRVTFTPAAAGSHGLTVRVTDDGPPPLSDEQRLTVDVPVPVAGAAAPEVPVPVQEPAPVQTPAPVAISVAAEQVLRCARRLLVLEDVVAFGGRVRLVGIADKRFIGRTVKLVFAPSRKVVATALVKPNGTFAATAPLPPVAVRRSSSTRYRASIDATTSLNLKLSRRLLITGVQPSGGRVRLTGRVVGPLARRPADRMIEVRRRLSCSSEKVVARVRASANGTFAISIRPEANATSGVYRLKTRVRVNTRSRAIVDTFTLPRAVDFGSG